MIRTMLDALYTKRYWDYLTTFVVHGLVDRFLGTGPTENAPNVAGNPMFDLLGIRYVLYDDKTGNRPPEWSGTQYRPVFKSGGVTVYENTFAQPRAFVVHDVHRVADADAALAYLKAGERPNFPDRSIQVVNKDVRTTAVVEADTGRHAGGRQVLVSRRHRDGRVAVAELREDRRARRRARGSSC